MGVGFFCSTHDGRLNTNRTFRLRNLTWERVRETTLKNLSDFVKLLEISRKMGFSVFRLGSGVVPYASHSSFQKEWAKALAGEIKAVGEVARKLGVRVTMHPGQYVVLNSKRVEVVENSLAELRYHFWLLDTMGLGPESVVVIHIGGGYGNKRDGAKRFVEVLEENKWLRRRLAIENDERIYTAAEVLEIAETLGVAMVFDYHHHRLNPSKVDFSRVEATWRGVRPEVHISSGDGPRHEDYVRPRDWLGLLEIVGDAEVDVIVEAKKKEVAAMRLLNI
ncbi:MAG: UV DNA damage repair endonuclease UvsE [Pyrobaculum sp.]